MASRWLSIALAGVGLACASWGQPRDIIARYCNGCHNSKSKAGGLALDTLDPDHASDRPEVWEKVVRKLRVRYMPPAGLPRPDERTYDSVIASLETTLDRAAAAKPNPGRTATFRRVNRTEYHNAIRDLLAVDIDVASMLPKDDASHGFDNITVGELSPTLLERYLGAAQKISRIAVGTPVKSPGGETITIPADLTQEGHLDELPFGTRGGAAEHFTFPVDGEYEVQLRLTRDRNEHIEGLSEPHQLELTLDGERVQLFTVKPVKASEQETADQGLRARIPVKAGAHTLAATFIKKSSALVETERQPYLSRFNMDRHPRLQPALYSISVAGPYGTQHAGDTPSRRQVFVCHPEKRSDEDGCAGRILANLTRHAWRRPVSDSEVQGLMPFYREGSASGGFENGIEMALRALLTSPQFLFRIEAEPTKTAATYRVSDIELASRLSFFLWSSIPDDALLTAASQGKLRQPAVLEREVRRMLADPRSEAFVNNFAEQWLYLRNLAAVTPDVRLYTDFDDNLRQSLRRETELFFDSILREDRNVLDLLRANYTFLDERLAKHYGIPDVYGSRFRRVTFDGDRLRGGLLRQGSILTVTSYANRTSPVKRGQWILANLLGSPPPPPPAKVPPLSETPKAQAATMRERMAQHRDNPACSGCHRMMDPVGFALENYDAIGRWREADATGALPNGPEFQGVDGLEKALLARPELFVSTLTEKLMTYALGRGLEPYDAPAVRKIVRDAAGQDYRFSALVMGIVQSVPFEMRRTE